MNIIFEPYNLEPKAGKAVESMIKSAQAKPLLLLVSGGSAMNILNYVDEGTFVGQNITVGLIDDRYTQDASASNFMLLKATEFYTKGHHRGVTFLNTSVKESETLEQFADRYETQLIKWRESNPEGIIKAVAGIGPDGHIAGILPFPENPEYLSSLMNGNKLIVGYDVGTKNPHQFRMTSTFTYMKTFDQTIVYVSGQSKQESLQKVTDSIGSLAETPARIVNDLHGVSIYTDIRLQ